MTLILSLLSALLYGSADFLCGISARKFPALKVLLLSQFVGGVFAIAAAPLVSGPGLPAFADLQWGALAGLSGLVGLGFLYTGLGSGKVAIVSPVSAFVSAIVPVVYGALSGEKPGLAALAGAALCVPAILLLAGDSEGGRDSEGRATGRPEFRSLLLGLVAGVFLGTFYIFISNCQESSGLWPLAGARLASLAGLGLFFAMRGLGRRSAGYKSLPGFTVYGGASPKIAAPGPEGAALARPGVSASAVATAAALCGGLLDISANLAFMYATRSGLLMIVSIVTSLYPAPTVLLAGIFLGEKLPPRRVAGLILALTGIVLVGIGA